MDSFQELSELTDDTWTQVENTDVVSTETGFESLAQWVHSEANITLSVYQIPSQADSVPPQYLIQLNINDNNNSHVLTKQVESRAVMQDLVESLAETSHMFVDLIQSNTGWVNDLFSDEFECDVEPEFCAKNRLEETITNSIANCPVSPDMQP